MEVEETEFKRGPTPIDDKMTNVDNFHKTEGVWESFGDVRMQLAWILHRDSIDRTNYDDPNSVLQLVELRTCL